MRSRTCEFILNSGHLALDVRKPFVETFVVFFLIGAMMGKYFKSRHFIQRFIGTCPSWETRIQIWNSIRLHLRCELMSALLLGRICIIQGILHSCGLSFWSSGNLFCNTLLHEYRSEVFVGVHVLKFILLKDHNIEERVIWIGRRMEEVALELNMLPLISFVVPLVSMHEVEFAFRCPLNHSHSISCLEMVRINLQLLMALQVVTLDPSRDKSDFSLWIQCLLLNEICLVGLEVTEAEDALNCHVLRFYRTLWHEHTLLHILSWKHVYTRYMLFIWSNNATLNLDWKRTAQ